ncbi:MAG: Bcr/CflA family efflux MFS transporter [Alphaproteobacteria bacterium]|nr:Bcr/CflA family efflux MFS transporter [Alphaproteobacteria bacterium]
MTVELNPKDIKVSVLLTLMVALGPLSTDLYLPSLPSLTETLSTTVSRVQATMSVFIAGFACATIIYGPLSDRFGRRPVLLGGLTVFVVGSLGCMIAVTIEELIVWRFVQAIGGCAGPVLVRAVVRDVYEKEEAARFLAYIASAMALAPAVAPMIGGWLHVLFGWRSHFVALTLLGVLFIWAVCILLRETNVSRDHTATQTRQMARNFSHILKQSQFRAFSLTLMFSYGALFSFISVGAFVVIGVLGVAPDRFGYLFFFVAIGYASGGLIAGKLVGRLGVSNMIGIGVALGLTVGILGLALSLNGIQTIAAVVMPVVGVFFACGFVLPAATAGALMPFPQIAGTASSAISFLQMSGGALIGFLAGYLHDGTTLPLFAVIFASWAGAALIYTHARWTGSIRPLAGATGA